MFVYNRPLAAVIAAFTVEATILGINWVYGLTPASVTESTADAPKPPCLHGAERDPGEDRADAAVLQARNPLLQHQARIYKSDDRIGTDQRCDD